MAQTTQSGRQVGTHLPSGEGSNSSQAGSQAGSLLPGREGSNLSQAGSQAVTSQANSYPRQAVRQALSFLQGKEAT